MAEQGRAERAAWEGEMFRLLAENVLDYALFIVDPHRTVLSWSKGAERLLGFTEPEIVGQKCDRFFTPEDVRDGVPQKELDEALATGRGDNERWHVRKDGSRFWSSGVVTPLRDGGGTLRAFARIMRDRTDLKQAQDAVRERQRQLKFVTDHAPVLLAQVDADRRFKFVNVPYAERFGLHPRDLIGRPVRDVLGAEAYAEAEPHIGAALAGRRVEYETDVPGAGGGVRTLRVAYEPERDGDGRVVGYVAAILDITDRKRAEQQSRRRAEEVETLMDVLPLGVFIAHDRDCRRITANPAGYAMLRLPPGSNLSVTPPPGEPPPFEARRDGQPVPPGELPMQYAAAHAAELRDVEVEHVYPDGTSQVLFGSASPLFDEAGAVRGAVAGFLDVTGQRRAEASLRESEGRLRTLSDNLPQGAVYQVVGQGAGGRRFLYVSAGIERLLGVTPAEAMADADAVYGLVHADDRAELAAREEDAAGGQTFDAEARMRTRAGELIWVHARSAARRLATGEVVWEGILMDVTARKRAEEALDRERELLGTIIDRIPVMLTVYDPDTRVLRLNPAFERATGWSARDAAGGSLMDRCYPDPAYREEVAEFMRSCREGWMDVRMRTRDGHDLETSWANIRLSDGTRVGIGLDITDRKRYEQSLRDADRRKDEFLATLAHELRNPLAPLRNGLQVMKLASGNAEAVEQARGVMERQLAQMVRLIDDLLDVSRITRGKLQLRRVRVELASVVQSAVENSRPLIESSAHRLSVALPPGPVFLDGDPVRLAQVFANLLTNAAKYTDRGGEIRLTADRHGGHVQISIRDTGIGIAPEHLPRLFEMFSQVAPALERSQGGLGIGLSLVKGVVEMHGGTVEARSEGLGRGSEFVVRLPLLAEGMRDEGGGMKEGPEGAGGLSSLIAHRSSLIAPASSLLRVLVADDNRDAADSLAMMLRLTGHEVHAVHGGPEAVEATGWFRPDLALLDIGMPKLNGLEVARRIREQPWGRGVVLVAVTGWGQEEDKRRALEAGFDHHLTKPVDPAALEKLLAGVSPAAD